MGHPVEPTITLMTLCVSCLQAAGPDHAEEHPGHEGPVRDPQQQGEHLRLNAGHTYFYSDSTV